MDAGSQSGFCHLKTLNPPRLMLCCFPGLVLPGLDKRTTIFFSSSQFLSLPLVLPLHFLHIVPGLVLFFSFSEQNPLWRCRLGLCKEFTVCFTLLVFPASDICFQTNYELFGTSPFPHCSFLKQGWAILSIMRWKSHLAQVAEESPCLETGNGGHDLSWPYNVFLSPGTLAFCQST